MIQAYAESANLAPRPGTWRELELPGGVLLKGKADALVTAESGEEYVVEHKSRMGQLRGVARKERLQCIAYMKLYPECRGCFLVETCGATKQQRVHRVESDEVLWGLAMRLIRQRTAALVEYSKEGKTGRSPLGEFLSSLLGS